MSFSTEQKEALKSIFNDQGFLYHKNGKFHFVGNRKTTSISNFLKMIGAPEVFEDIPELLALERAINKKALPVPDLLEVINEFGVAHAKRYASIEVEEPEDVGGFMKNLVPAINIGKGAKEKVILLDPSKSNRPVTDIDTDTYLTVTGISWQELLLDKNILKVMTCFDPYTLEYLIKKESKTGSVNIHHVNYYVPPRWRFVEAAPAFDGFIKDLVYHLFPNENEREYVLDWMHFGIIKRNETVLCLIGSRGTGKGILLNSIMGALVGNEYHQVAKQEVLTDKFNAEFKNKRFVFFDEVNVSGDRELNKFKALCNSRIAMEAKGMDSETIDNYVSMALSSNDKKDFKAEPQDRRFSVPEVTERPFLEVYTEEEIDEFCKRAEDPESEEIAAFGNWLIERKPVNSAQRPLKGKYFFELCRLSMPEWKLFIIDHVINEGVMGEPITNKQINKLFERVHGEKAAYPTRRGTIETFLGDYFHEGICKIGKVVEVMDAGRGRTTFAILPSEEFLSRFGKKYNSEALDAL